MQKYENNSSYQKYSCLIKNSDTTLPKRKSKRKIDITDITEPDHIYKNLREPPAKKKRLHATTSEEPEPEPEPEPYVYHQEYQDYIQQLPTEEYQQLKQIEQEIKKYTNENNKPLKYQILSSHAPIQTKALMIQKLNKLSIYDKNSGEYAYELSTLHQMIKIPWGSYVQLPITRTDSPAVIQDYLSNARQFLDSVTYGQHHAKSNLLLELSRYLENPTGQGFVLGVKGPPGSGKTTLISKGLAQVLNRPFFRIDLGGAKHSDSLFGTRKVFDRSDVGDLVRIVSDAKCMNPIIFFDELDKISISEYGYELINALNDLTDMTRNNEILDQYLGVSIDLSKAIFIFAYNSSEHIQETLRSRIHEIEVEPYTVDDKYKMSQSFLVPKACQKINMDVNSVSFTKEGIIKIIKHYTNQEQGVRELERKIDDIILKINWTRITHQAAHELSNYHFHSNLKISTSIPCMVTDKIVDQLLKMK